MDAGADAVTAATIRCQVRREAAENQARHIRVKLRASAGHLDDWPLNENPHVTLRRIEADMAKKADSGVGYTESLPDDGSDSYNR
jgi:hypothetical protein